MAALLFLQSVNNNRYNDRLIQINYMLSNLQKIINDIRTIQDNKLTGTKLQRTKIIEILRFV